MSTIPLCTLKGGNFNHVWRHVFSNSSNNLQGNRTSLWQCDDCKIVVAGRNPTPEEIAKGEAFRILTVEVPT